MLDSDGLEYVGFWARVAASIVDTILVALVSVPILHAVYGDAYWWSASLVKGPVDFFISWIFPVVAILAFWTFKQATPGKMLISARIVDAETGENSSTGQLIGRYFGYLVSTIPLFLGLVWVGIDSRKQGWHDKLAGTVVVRPRHRKVRFGAR